MRTKEAILNDAGISTLGMMSTLGLEVSIDIRDLLKELVYHLATVTNSLDNINRNLPRRG